MCFIKVEKVLNTSWDVVFSDELFAMGAFGIALRNAKINRKPYIMFSTTVLMQLFSWEQALGIIFAMSWNFFLFSNERKNPVVQCRCKIKAIFETLSCFACRISWTLLVPLMGTLRSSCFQIRPLQLVRPNAADH